MTADPAQETRGGILAMFRVGRISSMSSFVLGVGPSSELFTTTRAEPSLRLGGQMLASSS